MTVVRLPGLIDVHVHLREPGGEHKETWSTGTAAALAGGFTTVLAMPNTTPAVVDESSLDTALSLASSGARCDYALYVGAALGNANRAGKLADRTAGLKMYLGQTYGDLRLDDQMVWAAHLEAWPLDSTVAVHAEGSALEDVLNLAESIGRPIHVCHVAGADDIDLIARAKERGAAITCEATPHHLFLDQTTDLPSGRAEVRPRLGSPLDRQALWDHLDIIDCFATDHAPHTLDEKDGDDPPPGFPGLETALPLLLTAVHEGMLTVDDVVQRLHHRPAEIFGLPTSAETWVEVDVDEEFEIADSGHSRCGWTPFGGAPVRGRVTSVAIRGVTAYEHDQVIAVAGAGCDVRSEGRHTA
jgi:carbamoyl-phosphate synthase/aspartate carbamoyltransferase/dihydroorotase